MATTATSTGLRNRATTATRDRLAARRGSTAIPDVTALRGRRWLGSRLAIGGRAPRRESAGSSERHLSARTSRQLDRGGRSSAARGVIWAISPIGTGCGVRAGRGLDRAGSRRPIDARTPPQPLGTSRCVAVELGLARDGPPPSSRRGYQTSRILGGRSSGLRRSVVECAAASVTRRLGRPEERATVVHGRASSRSGIRLRGRAAAERRFDGFVMRLIRRYGARMMAPRRPGRRRRKLMSRSPDRRPVDEIIRRSRAVTSARAGRLTRRIDARRTTPSLAVADDLRRHDRARHLGARPAIVDVYRVRDVGA